jgi:hypothetical protein
MLTITAPGTLVGHPRLDFVTGRQRPEDYACGCESAMGDPGLWNRSASRRWNRLLTAIRRRHPGLQFVRAVEVQKRGLIHYHLAIACPESLDLQWVRDEAVRCGFGCSTQWQRVANPRYLAKYVTKSLDAPGLLWSELDTETGEVTATKDPRCRTISRSLAWGVTMRMLRDRKKQEAQARARQLAQIAMAAENPSGVGPGPVLPAPDP